LVIKDEQCDNSLWKPIALDGELYEDGASSAVDYNSRAHLFTPGRTPASLFPTA
jgi:hypothetical protein